MLYKCIQHPFTPALKLLRKQEDAHYDSRWFISTVNKNEFAAIRINIDGGSIGLGIEDTQVYQYGDTRTHYPAKLLLFGDELCYVQMKYLTELTDVLPSDPKTNSVSLAAITNQS